jgi:4-carboxymuconolactone decarboxylase
VKERRLVLIGLCMGSGLEDVAGLQLDAAVRLGELDADDLRTLVILLAHYAGWPRAAKLNSEVEALIARLGQEPDLP